MKYGDMLYMTYPFQTDRPRMNRADRAAQFSPFAALTGFDGVVAETARLTEERPEMSEEQKAAINDALMELLSRIRERPEAEIVYFRPGRTQGGRRMRDQAGKRAANRRGKPGNALCRR